MSLRLLPAIIMDNDEDDDGNFTKWMSSYWGHGAEGGHSRDTKRSFRRPSKAHVDRRASLPTVSQLDAMKLNRLHAVTMAPAPSHLKPRDEKGEVKPYQRGRRSSSDDNSHSKSAIPENRISTIPELAESFEKKLYLRDKRTMSLNDDDKLCLICHEDMRKNGGGVQELHCTHRFHKERSLDSFTPIRDLSDIRSLIHEGSSCLYLHEAARMLEQCRPRSSSEAAVCQMRRFTEMRRKSADGPVSTEKEQHMLRRQLSLRRHR